jgi:hypothetical protein
MIRASTHSYTNDKQIPRVMDNKLPVYINSKSGGNGDIWMRLVSFYAFAALLPKYEFHILLPRFFVPIARHVFGDRLQLTHEPDKNGKYLDYTVRGMRDLILPILKGKKYISPYQFAIVKDQKKKRFKDYINSVLFNAADMLGVVQVPPAKYINLYQGYLDTIGLRKLREVSYESYVAQLQKDRLIFISRFEQDFPVSEELVIPADLHQQLLFFPNGTSRQFVPVWWAVQHMPDAYYGFFIRDKEAANFINAGLKVVYFYGEPGDIVFLAKKAKWTFSTDSFPSHLLQYATDNCTIVLTEVLKSRIVSPAFRGSVVNATAPCHPCLHRARAIHPLCDAGHTECINWKDSRYSKNIMESFVPEYIINE